MRLFIAVNFESAVKDELCKAIEELKGHARKGNFTRRENLHLTLVFIGETENLYAIKAAMNRIDSSPFEVWIGKLGRFKRTGGDIYWAGVENSSGLTAIYNRLYKDLIQSGFYIEQREYKPHLTLGREVILDGTPNICVPEINVPVSKISLMKSERIQGKLTYTEIFVKELK